MKTVKKLFEIKSSMMGRYTIHYCCTQESFTNTEQNIRVRDSDSAHYQVGEKVNVIVSHETVFDYHVARNNFHYDTGIIAIKSLDSS